MNKRIAKYLLNINWILFMWWMKPLFLLFSIRCGMCFNSLICSYFLFIALDERQDVQKKTFTKWINARLSKGGGPLVEDLFEDLRDGHKLLALLEILTNQRYVSCISSFLCVFSSFLSIVSFEIFLSFAETWKRSDACASHQQCQ